MMCFLKKLFGQKCDEKKPEDLANNPEHSQEKKETGTDQLAPDSELSEDHSQEDHNQEHHGQESHSHEHGDEEVK